MLTPHTHPQFVLVLYCRAREEKGSRASVTHAFGDVYYIILCPGANFPFSLTCGRVALRLCADRQLRNVSSRGYPCDYPGNPFLLCQYGTRLDPAKRRSNRKTQGPVSRKCFTGQEAVVTIASSLCISPISFFLMIYKGLSSLKPTVSLENVSLRELR